MGVLASQRGLRSVHSVGCKCITARTGNRCRSVIFVTWVRGSLKYTQFKWKWHSESEGCNGPAVVISQNVARNLSDTKFSGFPLAGLYQSFLKTTSSWGPKTIIGVIFDCDPVLGSFSHLHLGLARGPIILSYFLRIDTFLLRVSAKIRFGRRRFAFKVVALQLVSHVLILLPAVHLFNNIISFFRDPPVLKAFNNTDVILRLPMGKRIRDIRWLSVWCRRFTVGRDRHLLLQLCVCAV